jgi:hypothetical protein
VTIEEAEDPVTNDARESAELVGREEDLGVAGFEDERMD